MKFAEFIDRYPYLSALGFLLFVIFVVVGFGALNEVFLMGTLVQLGAGDLALGCIGIFLVLYLGWWKKAGFATGIHHKDLPLFILPALFALSSLLDGIRVTAPAAVLGFALLTLIIGFAEETFFRGLIFTTLLPTGILRAVLLSSFIFAAPHFLNILGAQWDPYFTLVDSIAAFGIGVVFAALRLRTGSILPLIGLHALFDFCSLVSLGGIMVPPQSVQSLATSVIAGAVFVVYGFYLLRTENVQVTTV